MADKDRLDKLQQLITIAGAFVALGITLGTIGVFESPFNFLKSEDSLFVKTLSSYVKDNFEITSKPILIGLLFFLTPIPFLYIPSPVNSKINAPTRGIILIALIHFTKFLNTLYVAAFELPTWVLNICTVVLTVIGSCYAFLLLTSYRRDEK